MLGLPDGVKACLFDLDGVLTRTASVHAAAWKEMFDDFLRTRADEQGTEFVPFDAGSDYDRYVDGKPRADGTRSFLESRGINLPEGTAEDPPSAPTINGLGNRKNQLVLRKLDEGGAELFEGSVRYVKAAREAGLATAVVSSSANATRILNVTGIANLFDAVIDGVVAAERGYPGKPAPDAFLAGARALNVMPTQAAVYEDALAGVQAGRAGHFALVIGVDRVGQAAALAEHGADRVVEDLSELMEDS
ncbi:MAG: beta-phosphoglucomutase family hydrolase [Corynebacteriales bacterium]|nr:beta-phosphoglucomutase family hydrolase [Mycobacteriales bacterium]